MKTFIAYALVILSIFCFYLFKPQDFKDYQAFELTTSDTAWVDAVTQSMPLSDLSKYLIKTHNLTNYLSTSIKTPYTQPSSHHIDGIFVRDFGYNGRILLNTAPDVTAQIILFKDESNNYYVLYSYQLPTHFMQTNFYIDIKPHHLNYQLVANHMALKTHNKNYLLKYDALTFENNLYQNKRTYDTSSLTTPSFEGALLFKLNDFDPNYLHIDIDFYEPHQIQNSARLGMNTFYHDTNQKYIPSTQTLQYSEVF